MSCLNALPVSMQREIKQAYEKQNRGKRRNMLNLQQVQSPTKSPNKRYRHNYAANLEIFPRILFS